MVSHSGRTLGVGIALLALGLITAAAIGVARSNASQSQGLSGQMSALKGDETSPPGASSDVAKTVVEMANSVGGDPSTALATLRLLRGNLGSAREALYVFSTGKHSLCVVWLRGASCQTGSLTALPGVLLQLSPGGAGYPGLPDNLYAALAGVATDDVVSIALTTEGSSRRASVINNAFFLDLGLLADWPSSIEITATYADGSERSVALPNLAS